MLSRAGHSAREPAGPSRRSPPVPRPRPSLPGPRGGRWRHRAVPRAGTETPQAASDDRTPASPAASARSPHPAGSAAPPPSASRTPGHGNARGRLDRLGRHAQVLRPLARPHQVKQHLVPLKTGPPRQPPPQPLARPHRRSQRADTAADQASPDGGHVLAADGAGPDAGHVHPRRYQQRLFPRQGRVKAAPGLRLGRERRHRRLGHPLQVTGAQPTAGAAGLLPRAPRRPRPRAASLRRRAASASRTRLAAA